MPSRVTLAAPLLATALLFGAFGCQDDQQSPTDPSAAPTASAPAFATAALTFLSVSAGYDHTCGVAIDHRAYCWGHNQDGALGDGTTTDRSTPTPVSGGLSFLQVTAGQFYSCGVTTTNRAYCWGQNRNGVHGDGTQDTHWTPVPVRGGLLFRVVRAGDLHTCGITLTDETWCWGLNRSGQLGDGSSNFSHKRPVLVFGGRVFRQVDPGGANTCGATTGNRGFCWGSGTFGQVGAGDYFEHRTPKAISGGLSFSQVLTGTSHSCGVTTANRAYCWGTQEAGFKTNTPAPVPGAVAFSLIAPGALYTCGVNPANRVYCWGENEEGQLGDGTRNNHAAPAPVADDHQFKGVSTGSRYYQSHSCAVTTTGQAYCWGHNGYGQVGDGTSGNRRLKPVAVAGP
jgi:alpha-tubulin suppressor-like RCC1 family protein